MTESGYPTPAGGAGEITKGVVRSLLGFGIFSSLLIGLLVFVVVPVVAGPIISGYMQSAGLVQGTSITVDTEGSGPDLVTGRADSLRLRGSDVDVQGVMVGDVDVTLRGVSLTARTFDSVDGRLRRIRVHVPDGPTITVATVELAGPSAAVRAIGHLDEPQAVVVIREAAGRAGYRLDGVTLGDGTVQVEVGGFSVTGRLAVRNGALVLDAGESLPSVELIVCSADAPWTLHDVTVRPDGLELSGTLDVRGFATAAGVLVP